jgi:flagellar biosynthesis protein FlhG
MDDQAAELRQLIVPFPRTGTGPGAGPRTLIVSGGRSGVGATTVAFNLAAALAADALRVVLIDADVHRAGLAGLCGLTKSMDFGDVLAGRKSVHEALLRGPAGIQILAGSATAETRNSLSERSIQRLERQIRSLQPHADWVIIDTGHQATELTARLWSHAERVLLVTSPDAAAVMDSYALVKTLLSRQRLARPLALAVNRAEDVLAAADVHRRIDQSCRRFLGISLDLIGGIPAGAAAANAGRELAPVLLTDPDSMLADAVNRIARQIFSLPAHSALQRKAA